MQDPDQDAYEPDDDHVEIQVEAEEDPDDIPSQNKIVIEDPNEDQYGIEVERHNNNKSTFSNGQDQAATNGMDGNDFANMMNGFNNMDYNQMMQMMAANGMGNFNPMMGKSIHYITVLVALQLTCLRITHGNEYDVIRHVWWFWWPQ
jgi:hypothetical protein